MSSPATPTLTPLNPRLHAGLHLRPSQDYGFARAMLLAPIVLDELAEVAREYAIVFPQGSELPCALLGVQEGCNAYVGPDGTWLARYVPAHIRHQPFALGLPEAGSAVAGLLVDLGSPLLGPAPGEPLFDERGAPAAALQSAIDLLQALHARQGVTRAQVQAIERAGLLVERGVEIRHADGEVHRVRGLRVIDEPALNALDTAAFDQLRRSGALPLVYAHLLSFAHLRQGPIGRAHPLPANAGLQDLPEDSPWLP